MRLVKVGDNITIHYPKHSFRFWRTYKGIVESFALHDNGVMEIRLKGQTSSHAGFESITFNDPIVQPTKP